MTIHPQLLPFEFVVVGKPVSHQTKNKQILRDWCQTVHNTARNYWKNPPTGEPLQVVITHYFEATWNESGVPDNDNIIKPVRDAMNGVIYVDDYQITDFLSRRRNLNGPFRVKGMSAVLADAFSKGEEFLHILVKSAPNPIELS